MTVPYGDVIKRLRDARGWTQGTLAERSGLNRETIVRAEQSGNVGVLLLVQIADALDVEISALFGGVPLATETTDEVVAIVSQLRGERRAQVLRMARRLLLGS